jgi:plasmid stability protein
MASITIRNLDDDLKRRLRRRAAEHDRSMEEEARIILKDALESRFQTGADLWRAIRAIVEPIGGIELDIPPREPIREPPDFGRHGFSESDDE